MSEQENAGTPQEDLEGKQFALGPSPEPWWKFKLAQYVFWLVRLSPVARYVIKIPGAERVGKWGFKVTVLSRPSWEVSDSD